MFTTNTVAYPFKKRALQGRRLIAIDIENVAGGAVVTPEIAEQARSVIETALDLKNNEQVVIGISHIGLFNAKGAWSSARIKVRSGDDGADIELVDILSTEQIHKRFDEVVLVSGDGVFTDVVSRFASHGVKVTVASWVSSLSSSLRVAAARTIYLDDWSARPNYQEAA